MKRLLHLSLLTCLVTAATPVDKAWCAEVVDTTQPSTRLARRGLLLDIATAGKRLVAVGDHGVVVYSDDDGRSWQQASVPAQTMLTAVAFADNAHGWAVGHGGLILGTNDGGTSWAGLESPASEDDSFLDVLAITAEHVIAVGAYGLACETRDGGMTWETRHVLEEDMHINRLTRAADGTIFLAGESGTLAVSRDNGDTFETLAPPYEGSLYGFHEITGGTWLVHGLRGHVFISRDAGSSWEQSAVEREVLVTCAVDFSPKRLLLGGVGGWIFTSRDGGRIFSARSAHRLETVAEMIRTPGGRLAMVGDGGVEVVDVP